MSDAPRTTATPSPAAVSASAPAIVFDTVQDRVLFKTVPQAIRSGMGVAQAAVAGGLIAGPLGAAVAGGSVYALGKAAAFGLRVLMNMGVSDLEKNVEIFDVATEDGRAAMTGRGALALHPHFFEDYERLCRDAGLEPLPIHLNAGGADSVLAGSVSHGDAHYHIELSPVLFDKLDRREINAVIAHEIGHAAMNHGISLFNDITLRGTRLVAGVTAVAVTAVTAPALLPLVIPAVLLMRSADKLLSSIESRHKEKGADRAAVLLTGDADGFKAAFRKINDVFGNRQTRKAPGKKSVAKKVRAILRKIDAQFLPLGLRRAIHLSHPRDETRNRLNAETAAQQAAFCESRRALFREAFNAAAARPLSPTHINMTNNFSANRLKSEHKI